MSVGVNVELGESVGVSVLGGVSVCVGVAVAVGVSVGVSVDVEVTVAVGVEVFRAIETEKWVQGLRSQPIALHAITRTRYSPPGCRGSVRYFDSFVSHVWLSLPS